MLNPKRITRILQTGQNILLSDGLRNTSASHLLLEFKYSESLNASALLQALSYDYFYRQSQELNEQAVQSFVMVARTPRSTVLEHFGYQATEVAGLYQSQQPLLEKVQVIILNQLQTVAHNAFVQCFASHRRIRNQAFDRLQEMDSEQINETLLELVMGLRSQINVKEGVMQTNTTKLQEGLTAEKLINVGKEIRQLVLASLTPKERKALLEQIKPEERLAGLAPEDRLAGLAPEDRLAGLAPDEMAELFEQLENYLHQYQDKRSS